MSRTSPWGLPATSWAQGGPHNDTWDLWRYRWEGPSGPSVGEGTRHWEHLPPMERSHEGKAMSTEYLMPSQF